MADPYSSEAGDCARPERFDGTPPPSPLIILGGVVALILLIALAIPLFLNGDAFRTRIETALTTSLGRKVLSRRAAGSVHHQSSAAKRSRNIGGLSCALWGVSQSRVIIGKFPQETFIFYPGGGYLFFTLSRMPGVSVSGGFPVWSFPIFIVRHSRLIKCKVERRKFVQALVPSGGLSSP